MMKIALRLFVVLLPLSSLGQVKKSNDASRTIDAPLDQPLRRLAESPRTSALEVQGPSILALDSACNACKGAPITLAVHNKSFGNAPLALSVGEITSVQGEKDFKATISLIPLDERGNEDPGKAFVASGKSLNIKAVVVGTLDQGTWQISLLNQGKPFGTFKVQNSPVTFDVKPEIADPTNPELKFGRVEPTLITIKNDDVSSFRMECAFTIGEVSVPCQPKTPERQGTHGQDKTKGQSAAAPDFKVSSKASTEVLLYPDAQWFTTPQTGKWWDRAGSALHALRGLISEYPTDGRLTIRMRSNNCNSDAAAPVKTFRFKSRLSLYSDEARQISSFVVVFLVLFAGAMLSVLANLLLPGAARRLKVKEELAICSRKISDLSLDLDSRIRVPLGVERARLSRRLEEQGTVSPDFSIAIAEIEKDVAGLKSRVDILEKMELVLRRYWKMRREARLPMSLAEGIEDIRQQATDILARSEPKDTDLQNAQLLIQEIEKRITSIDQPNPAFAQQLVARLQKLKKDINNEKIVASDTLGELRKNLSGLFEKFLKTELPKAEEINPADYVDLDSLVFQMAIVNRYNALVNSPVDDKQKARLNEHRNRLLGFLRQAGSESLYQARSLIQQLEENVFPEDVAKALTDHQVQIECDRNVVYQFESAGFRLLFLNRAVATSTARREFMVNWNFGDGLSERGGWVSHYFAEPTVLSTVLPWGTVIRRLAIALVLAYLVVGLPLAWGLSRVMSHFGAILLSVIVVAGLMVLVTALAPLGRRFGRAIKKKRNPNLDTRETDPRFFRSPYALKASLTKPDGTESLTVSDNLEVYKTPHTRLPATFWVEATRTAIALLIALAGLVSGAKEQLLKLDVFPALVAVFMIGFGANEVKKLFSQNPQP